MLILSSAMDGIDSATWREGSALGESTVTKVQSRISPEQSVPCHNTAVSIHHGPMRTPAAQAQVFSMQILQIN